MGRVPPVRGPGKVFGAVPFRLRALTFNRPVRPDLVGETPSQNLVGRVHVARHKGFRKWTHRSTTSNPSAAWARWEGSSSIHVSDASSRAPMDRDQSSAAVINAR